MPNGPGAPPASSQSHRTSSRVYPFREIIDAVFYVVRSGRSWRLLPHEFLPWRSVYHCFGEFRLDGTWERMHAALRERVRVRLERNPRPSAGPTPNGSSLNKIGCPADAPSSLGPQYLLRRSIGKGGREMRRTALLLEAMLTDLVVKEKWPLRCGSTPEPGPQDRRSYGQR
jgi:transposase